MNLAVLMTCLVSLFAFTSCDKDDDDPKESSIIGTWYASQDIREYGETYHIEYTLKFNSDKSGSIRINDDGDVETEYFTWSIPSSHTLVMTYDYDDEEYDDEIYYSLNGDKLVLDFGGDELTFTRR